MSEPHTDENDIAALRARYKPQAPPLGAAAAGRRAAERKATQPRIAANDGRKLRATGRTAQLNVTVRPEIKELVSALALARGSTVVALIEDLIEAAARCGADNAGR